jgi:hypothetical protein
VIHGPKDYLYRYELPDFLSGRLRDAPGVECAQLAPCVFTSPFLLRARRIVGLRAHYDYLAAGKDKVRLFLLTDREEGEEDRGNWSFAVHLGRVHRNTKSGRWDQEDWSAEVEIRVAFREPFQVLGKGEDDYFVTASGRLFLAKRAAKGKQRSCVPV